MSGAGKSSALKALEDLGFEAVDNVPLSLLKNLVTPGRRALPSGGVQRPLAIGADIRTREFGHESLIQTLDELSADEFVEIKILFLDCDDGELVRRYAETRHRHPLAADRPVRDGIKIERGLVSPLRDAADIALNTTGMALGNLKRILRGHFGEKETPGLSVFVTSFAFRRGLPLEADLVFDVRFLANPHYVPALRPLSGLDPKVAGFVSRDSGFDGFFSGLTGLLMPLMPRYAAEGKSYLTIAIGCTGGRHRSVAVAERLAAWMTGRGQPVTLHHRDLGED
jgi:UPF0042 nucleotide-binding protein